jgi:hypothetical protein
MRALTAARTHAAALGAAIQPYPYDRDRREPVGYLVPTNCVIDWSEPELLVATSAPRV